MNHYTSITLNLSTLTLAIFLSGCIYVTEPSQTPTITYTPISTATPTPSPTPDPTPDPTPYISIAEQQRNEALKITGYTPTLRYYDIDKSQELWHAENPSSYIIPNNAWIVYYVSTGKTPQTQYRTDAELYPNNPDKDVWQNADYTLYTGTGDCEDLSIVEASILRAKGINAIVVGGYLEETNGNKIRDFWVEYVSENQKFTKLTTGSAVDTEYKLIPLFMFNDQITWRDYETNWNNN